MLPLRKQDVIERVRATVADDSRIRLVVLFGSYAQDRARPDSDVDIAVDAPGMNLPALSATLSERLGVEVDVVPLAAASIPMLEELVAYGVAIHESPKGSAAAWRSRVLAQLETDRPWYRRMRDAWLSRVARDGLGGGQ